MNGGELNDVDWDNDESEPGNSTDEEIKAVEQAVRDNMHPSKWEIEYAEDDCGRACTPNGCMGHPTNLPIAITIGGIKFELPQSAYDGVLNADYAALQEMGRQLEAFINLSKAVQ